MRIDGRLLIPIYFHKYPLPIYRSRPDIIKKKQQQKKTPQCFCCSRQCLSVLNDLGVYNYLHVSVKCPRKILLTIFLFLKIERYPRDICCFRSTG